MRYNKAEWQSEAIAHLESVVQLVREHKGQSGYNYTVTTLLDDLQYCKQRILESLPSFTREIK